MIITQADRLTEKGHWEAKGPRQIFDPATITEAAKATLPSIRCSGLSLRTGLFVYEFPCRGLPRTMLR